MKTATTKHTWDIPAAPPRLSYGMQLAQQALRPEIMFAYLIWLILVGWTFNFVLLHVEGTVLRRLNYTGSAR